MNYSEQTRVVDDAKLFVWGPHASTTNRFKGVIKRLSGSQSFEDSISQWEFDLLTPTNTDICICSNISDVIYSLRNKNNLLVVPVCPDCIIKFCPKEIKEIYNLLRKIRRYQGDRRICLCCCEYKISKENNDLRCLSCASRDINTVSGMIYKIFFCNNPMLVDFINEIKQRQENATVQNFIASKLVLVEEGEIIPLQQCSKIIQEDIDPILGIPCDDLGLDFNVKLEEKKDIISIVEKPPGIVDVPIFRECVNCKTKLHRGTPARYKYCEPCYRITLSFEARKCNNSGCNNVVLNDKSSETKYCVVCSSKIAKEDIVPYGLRKCNQPNCNNLIPKNNPQVYKSCLDCHLKIYQR